MDADLYSVTQRKFPYMAPAALPLRTAGPTLSVTRLMVLISLPTWLWAALPLPWPEWAYEFSVLVTAAIADPTVVSLWSVRRAEGTKDNKGASLGILPYSKALVATGQRLRFLSWTRC